MLARVKNLTEAMTKTQMFSDIAEKTALTKRQVADVFEALESVIERHVQKGAVGACTIPGLMKIKVVKKPAQRARKNVPNPFRPGETMDVQAKPASTSVKGSAAQEAERHGVGVRRTSTLSRGALWRSARAATGAELQAAPLAVVLERSARRMMTDGALDGLRRAPRCQPGRRALHFS